MGKCKRCECGGGRLKFAQPRASLIDYMWRHLHQLPAKHDPQVGEVVESDSGHVVEGLLHLVRSGIAVNLNRIHG